MQYQQEKLNEPTKKGPLSYVLHESPFATVSTRETSEGWPLLTVETKAIGDLYSRIQLKGSFPGWFVGLAVLEQEIFILPWLF